MCGIAGLVGPWKPSLVSAMTEAISHRGPDGAGLWSDYGIALGHRRLSIIDLSAAAAQPMHTPDGRYVLTYNGEIYNYRELRNNLENFGVTFHTSSDSEVLLHLFARDGLTCLEKLTGIFSFAIWDRESRTLSLARDHLGVKPLYYAMLPQGFLFASELKALTLCSDLPRDIDPATVGDHLGYLWTASERTMLQSVKKLRPGCTITLSADGELTHGRFYRPPQFDPTAPLTSFDPAALQMQIDRIVADQMIADVEVGALLSGGVDSSAIVAAMCHAAEPSKITAFCAAVKRPETGTDNFGDDQAYARTVAENLGVKLIEVPTDVDLINTLPAMVWQLDEPTADFAAAQTLMLAREARENGVKVLLSGVGGDDLFTGYGRHTAGLIWAIANRVPWIRLLGASVLEKFSSSSIFGRRLHRLGALLSMEQDAMLANGMSYSAINVERRRTLLAPGVAEAMPADGIAEGIRNSLDTTRGRHPVERFIDLELNGFLPDHNLNYTDKMAMQAGVEVRVPLVDHRLVESAMQLPISAKISLRETKRILRASQRARLPTDVLTRPKQGFGVPVRHWLQGEARELLEDLTSTATMTSRGLFSPDAVTSLKSDFQIGRVDAAFTLFPIMAIELWCRALESAETVPT